MLKHFVYKCTKNLRFFKSIKPYSTIKKSLGKIIFSFGINEVYINFSTISLPLSYNF